MKLCQKGLHQFDGRRCGECRNISRKNWHNANLNKEKAAQLKHNYGISLDQYNQLFIDQNGCCGICSIHQSELSRALAVDHDHSTNEIRGLLCSSCNTGLGLLQDSSELLESAIKYKQSFKTGLKIAKG